MSDSHPFLSQDFKIKWSTLTPDQIKADVTKAVETGKDNIEAVKTITPDEANFENTFGALESATDDLDRSWGRVNHLDSVANSDELREALNEMLPIVSEFSSSISLDDSLWKVLKSYSESDAITTLTEIQQRFVEETCNDFKAAGADLDPDSKKRMFEINAELAKVTQKFGENVLDSTNAWELYVDSEDELEGLPESAKTGAAEDAKSKGKEGQWRFTQQFPSMYPVMQYAETAELRKKIWEGSGTIGHGGDHDNTEQIWEILKLRQEKADLLGFSNFADHVLNRRMAKSGTGALEFTEDLHSKISESFKEDMNGLEAYWIKNTGRKTDQWNPGMLLSGPRSAARNSMTLMTNPCVPTSQSTKSWMDYLL
jgi:oligopeptidase A